MLEVEIDKTLGATRIAAAFTAGAGLTAIVGPSGAGKTTILNAVAGLVRPDAGRIALGGTVLFDAARRVDLPARGRRVGYVFQEARLFPHLSVAANLAYGRVMNRLARDPDEEARIVALLGIGHLMRRRPRTLSGGEAQRVAIGRALIAQPRLLLFDEPLAALDAARREEIMPYLERLRDEARVPILYVSHADAEVRRLASRIVRLEAGRVVGVEEAA